MNTGQLLVSLSGLPTGSAMTHLMAITTGSGTGTGETIFAHQMTVVASQRSTTVTSRAKRTAPSEPLRSGVAQKADSKYAYALTQPTRVSVLTSIDAVFVLDTANSKTVSTRRDEVFYNRKQ